MRGQSTHRTLFSLRGLRAIFKKINLKLKKSIIKLKCGGGQEISEIKKIDNLYNKLRKDKKFRKYDFLVDDFFETMSIQMDLPPYLFVEAKLK